jgi:hypothetical protein
VSPSVFNCHRGRFSFRWWFNEKDAQEFQIRCTRSCVGELPELLICNGTKRLPERFAQLMFTRKPVGNNQSGDHPEHDATQYPEGHDETGVAFKAGGAGNPGVRQSAEQPGKASA